MLYVERKHVVNFLFNLQITECVLNSKPTEKNNGFLDLSFEENTKENTCLIEPVQPRCPNNLEKIEDNDVCTKKCGRTKNVWVPYGQWDDLDTVLDFFEDEGFTFYDFKDLIKGQKFYFRCKRTPKAKKPYCNILYIVYLPSDTNETILLHNSMTHNHAELLAGKKRMMSDDMVDFVNRLFEKRLLNTPQLKNASKRHVKRKVFFWKRRFQMLAK